MLIGEVLQSRDQTMGNNYLHSSITSEIIGAFFRVYNQLGYGFLEKVYENALMIELRNCQLTCIAQAPIKVYYEKQIVGHYITDIIVNDCVIIEVKAADSLCKEHEVQLINYLKATEIEVGMLLNFGKSPQFKRKVFSKEFKKHN